MWGCLYTKPSWSPQSMGKPMPKLSEMTFLIMCFLPLGRAPFQTFHIYNSCLGIFCMPRFLFIFHTPIITLPSSTLNYPLPLTCCCVTMAAHLAVAVGIATTHLFPCTLPSSKFWLLSYSFLAIPLATWPDDTACMADATTTTLLATFFPSILIPKHQNPVYVLIVLLFFTLLRSPPQSCWCACLRKHEFWQQLYCCYCYNFCFELSYGKCI